MKLGLIFITLLGALAQTIYMPTGSVPTAQIISCTGSSPTVCITHDPHGLLVGDIVLPYTIVEYNGTKNLLSALNAPAGSARKIGTTPTNSSFTLTDLSGTQINTSNTVLINSGFIRKVVASTLNPQPRGGLDGLGNSLTMQVSATIYDATLTSIVVSSNVATIHYAFPHSLPTRCNTPGTCQVQVRNATLSSDLNGIKNVTVANTTTVTYSTTSGNGTDTSTNLGVSAFAIDGSIPWEHIKSWNSTQGQPGWENFMLHNDNNNYQQNGVVCGAAASLWFVDRAQSQAKTFMEGCVVTYYEDFAPAPEFCGTQEDCDTSSPFITLHYANDNNRLKSDNIGALYSIATLDHDITSGQLTTFRNYWLNDQQDNCFQATFTTGPGTISNTATPALPAPVTITGVGTTFTTSFTVGDYFLTTDIIYCRVITITDNTHMTATSNCPISNGVIYFVLPKFSSAAAGSGTGCGVQWWINHYGTGSSILDSRLVSQGLGDHQVAPDYGFPQSDYWIGQQLNNQTATTEILTQYINSAMASEDIRALRNLAGAVAWQYDYNGSGAIASWGGSSWSAWGYGQGRVMPLIFQTLTIAQTSIQNFPDILSGASLALRSQAYNAIYSWLPSSSVANPYQFPWGGPAFNGQVIANDEYFFGIQMLINKMPRTDAAYLNYWLNVKAPNITIPHFNYHTPVLLDAVNPNIGIGSTDFTTLPLQANLALTDGTACNSLGLWCNAGNDFYWHQGMAQMNIWSRQCWTNPSCTVVQQTSLTCPSGFGAACDHGIVVPGSYKIIKESTNGDIIASAPLAGCMIGDADSACGLAPGTDNQLVDATVLNLGALSNTVSPNQGAQEIRWSGADLLFGDSLSRYASWTIDLKNYWSASEGVVYAQTTYTHLKKTGSDEIMVVYDSASKTNPTDITRHTMFPQGAPGAYTPTGTSTYTSGLVNSTNADGFRLLSTVLKPAGSTSSAVTFNLHTSGTGNVAAYDLASCSSTNGTTCNTSATNFENITVHWIGTNSNSIFAPTLLSPDANWTGTQACGPTSCIVALMARGGTTYNAITSFNTTHSNTAQYLFSGLTPGTYTITLNSNPIAGSPFTVVPGDNSIYFESTSGLIGVTFGNIPVVTGVTQISGKIIIN